MISDVFTTALQRLAQPESIGVIVALVLSSFIGRIFMAAYKHRDLSKLPMLNGKKWWQLTANEQRVKFCTQAKYMIDDAFANTGDKFLMQTDNGVELVLSANYANGIKDNAALCFGAHMEEEFHINIDGFKPWRQGRMDHIFQDAVQINLTQDISTLNVPLSEEATNALEKLLTNDAEWHEIPVKVVAFKIISQMSSRVFLGEELCRNEDWLQVTVDYTRDAVIAAQELRTWPKLLRPFAFKYANPRCKAIQAQLQKSEDLINPVLEKRRRETEERKKAGLKPIRHQDGMQWMDDAAKGRKYEAAAAQIMMAIAANFTGSDMLTGALILIAQDPKLVEDMRKEIITVMGECQWNKSTLYKLRLMDSVLKETQRMKPAAIAVMRRKAIEDTQLPDGTKIPKGTNLMVSTHKSWDASTYSNPEKFDGYRFLRKREEEKNEAAQFVSTTPESLGFGLGKFACPGRFFAANELKIVLSHIIMKYDIKLVPGTTTETQFYSLFSMGNDNAKIMVRRRQEELAL